MAINPAEAFVEELCRASFLTLWLHADPPGRSDKELCDVLVVCAPDLVIISVKEIAPSSGVSELTRQKRWYRKAIQASVKQLYGAERFLQGVTTLATNPRVTLPLADTRRVYRVAFALGGKGEMPIISGDFGKGFVHVFDDVTGHHMLHELDTISDFTHYLGEKESLLSDTNVLLNGGEEDLLAVHLHNGRSFPKRPDFLAIEPNCWDDLRAKPEWNRRKAADQGSRTWDQLIESITVDARGQSGPEHDRLEAITRVMAREDRFARRILSDSLVEFQRLSACGEVRSRIVPSPSGTRYVLLATRVDGDREHRIGELGLRCFVARGLAGEPCKVVGLATAHLREDQPLLFDDYVLLDIPEWTDKEQAQVDGIQEDLGYFKSPRFSHESIGEYPKGEGDEV